MALLILVLTSAAFFVYKMREKGKVPQFQAPDTSALPADTATPANTSANGAATPAGASASPAPATSATTPANSIVAGDYSPVTAPDKTRVSPVTEDNEVVAPVTSEFDAQATATDSPLYEPISQDESYYTFFGGLQQQN